MKLVWMADCTLRVLTLPVLAAMNGSTAFLQSPITDAISSIS